MDGWSPSLPPAICMPIAKMCNDISTTPSFHVDGELQHGRVMSGSRPEDDSPVSAAMVGRGERGFFPSFLFGP